MNFINSSGILYIWTIKDFVNEINHHNLADASSNLAFGSISKQKLWNYNTSHWDELKLGLKH
jgi:hypothetical protein